ncbi:MAG: YdcF family protein, partial [Hydrocarboniphaga effusa]|nr:YdcF family protein [Hydrocarboniphaga effusa]
LAMAVLFLLLANRWVINSTDSYLYRDSALMPENEVGLVLGCSSYATDGKSNPQFYGRIEAAAQLYRLGKVKRLILSGANPDARYNEPKRMQEALIEKGIPSEALTLDFAGDRTFDSIIRAREVSGLSRVTIVTQKYHAYRALFLARKTGLQAVGFAAPLADGGEGFRHPPREIFARALAVLDLYRLYAEQALQSPAAKTSG